MPWLHQETGKYVSEMDSLRSYPDTLVGNFVMTKTQIHQDQVKAYADKITARRAAE